MALIKPMVSPVCVVCGEVYYFGDDGGFTMQGCGHGWHTSCQMETMNWPLNSGMSWDEAMARWWPEFDSKTDVWCVTKSCKVGLMYRHIALTEAIVTFACCFLLAIQFPESWLRLTASCAILLPFITRVCVLSSSYQRDRDWPFFLDFLVVLLFMSLVLIVSLTHTACVLRPMA